MRRSFIAVLTTLLLSSCAASQHTLGIVSPVPAAPAAAPVNAGAGIQNNVKVGTEIAGPKTYLPPLPTAVIILKDPEGDTTQAARNLEFCQSFEKIQSVQQVIAGSALAQNVIATRWLIDVNSATSHQTTDCTFLLSNYDFQRAGLVMGSIPLSSQKPVGKSKAVSWSEAGPFVVEIFPDNHVAIADASGVVKQGDFDRFAEAWLNSAQAQQQAVEGKDASTVAATVSGTQPGQTPPSAATTAAKGATKAASVNSLGVWKDAYGVATFLLELIPAVAPAVKVATTVVGEVCKVVGTS